MRTYVLSIKERERGTYASMAHTHFAIDSEIRKQYTRFNAVGTQLTWSA